MSGWEGERTESAYMTIIQLESMQYERQCGSARGGTYTNTVPIGTIARPAKIISNTRFIVLPTVPEVDMRRLI